MSVVRLMLAVLAATVCQSPAYARSTTTSALVARWHALNVECRGGPGDAGETMFSCGAREEVSRQLKERGCKYHIGDRWTCKAARR